MGVKTLFSYRICLFHSAGGETSKKTVEKWLEVGKEEWLKENTEHLFDTSPAKTFLRSFVAFFYPVSCVWQIRMRIFRSIAGLARYAALKYFTLNGDPSETARLLSSLRSASLTIQNLCEYKFPWFSPFLSLSLSLSRARESFHVRIGCSSRSFPVSASQMKSVYLIFRFSYEERNSF